LKRCCEEGGAGERERGDDDRERLDGALVTLTIARLFERAGRERKSRKWYTRVTAMAERFGDGYVHWLAFEYLSLYRQRLVREGVVSSEGEREKDGHGSQGERENGGGGVGEEEREREMDGIDEEEDEEDEREKDSSVSASVDASSSTANAMEGESEGDREGEREKARGRDGLDVMRKIVKLCREKEPNRGELWCTVSKETELRRQDYGSILIAIAEKVLGFRFFEEVKEILLG
jgi:hypothetical protein